MAAYQYIYVMKGLNKTYPGRQAGPEGHLAVVPARRQDRRAGPQRRRQVDPAARSWPARTTDFTGEAWAAEGVKVGYPRSRSRSSTRRRTCWATSWTAPARWPRMLDRFEEVSNAFSDPDADMDKLIAEQAELQEKIDAGNGWDLGRTVEIAMDALRCPPGDADVEQAVGRRAPPRGALPAAAQQARHAAARRADQPSRRRIGGLAGALPRRVTPAPSWPSPTTATSSTMSRAGSSSSTAARGIPWEGNYTVLAGAEGASGSRRKRRPPTPASRTLAARAGMDGPERRRRGAPRARRASRPTSSWSSEEREGDARDGADRHPGRAAARRSWSSRPRRSPRASATGC